MDDPVTYFWRVARKLGPGPGSVRIGFAMWLFAVAWAGSVVLVQVVDGWGRQVGALLLGLLAACGFGASMSRWRFAALREMMVGAMLEVAAVQQMTEDREADPTRSGSSLEVDDDHD